MQSPAVAVMFISEGACSEYKRRRTSCACAIPGANAANMKMIRASFNLRSCVLRFFEYRLAYGGRIRSAALLQKNHESDLWFFRRSVPGKKSMRISRVTCGRRSCFSSHRHSFHIGGMRHAKRD